MIRKAVRRGRLAALVLVVGFHSPQAPAQESKDREGAIVEAAAREAFQSRTYGTADTIIQQIPSAAFQLRSGDPIQELCCGYVHTLPDLGGVFVAPLNLPNGALVHFLNIYAFDTDSGSNQGLNDVRAELVVVSGATPPAIGIPGVVYSGGSSGYVYNFQSMAPPIEIDNSNRYFVYVRNARGPDKGFGSVSVWYKLQMTPAPLTATFADVPTSHLYFRAIEALAASGITQGCGAGNFCPNQNVTRGEMAAFLARALGLHWPF